jgi:hypothetical protein
MTPGLWKFLHTQATGGFSKFLRRLIPSKNIMPLRPRSKEKGSSAWSRQSAIRFRDHDIYVSARSDKAVGMTQQSNPGDLMLCWTAPGTHRSRLVVLHLQDLQRDEEFFEALRYMWSYVRGWTRFIVTVKSIHYVKASILLLANTLAIWDVVIANGFQSSISLVLLPEF